MAMDATDGTSFDPLAEFKKTNSYGKRSSFPGSVMKNPNDIFNVFRGAMGTLQAMRVEEEQEQFYEPIDENSKTEQSNILQEELHLPDLQDRLIISNADSTTKYVNVNDQVRSPRRRSFAVPTHIKKSPRDSTVITVESNAPSARFWTHPASPPENITSTSTSTPLNLPQISGTTNGSKNAYAKSCIDGPQKSKTRREEIVKKNRRSNSLIFPYRPSTFGKSLQAKWSNGTYSRRRHSKARSSWKIQLHERKPHFTS